MSLSENFPRSYNSNSRRRNRSKPHKRILSVRQPSSGSSFSSLNSRNLSPPIKKRNVLEFKSENEKVIPAISSKWKTSRSAPSNQRFESAVSKKTAEKGKTNSKAVPSSADFSESCRLTSLGPSRKNIDLSIERRNEAANPKFGNAKLTEAISSQPSLRPLWQYKRSSPGARNGSFQPPPTIQQEQCAPFLNPILSIASLDSYSQGGFQAVNIGCNASMKANGKRLANQKKIADGSLGISRHEPVVAVSKTRIKSTKSKEIMHRWSHVFASVKNGKNSLSGSPQDELAHLLRDTAEALDMLGPKALSTTAHHVAFISSSTGWDAGPSIWSSLEDCSVRMLGHFSTRQLSDMLWAFAKAGERSLDFFEAAAREAIPRLGQFSPRALSVMAWAFAAVGIPASELFREIAKVALPRMLESCDCRHITKVAWSFAVLDHECANLAAPGSHFINACNSKRELFCVRELNQLHQFQLWLHEHHTSSRLDPKLSEKCSEAFVDDKAVSPSNLQKDVSATLKMMGLSFNEEVTTDIGYSIDIVLEYRDKIVDIEVDGPCHFFNGSPNGATIIKRRQLAKLTERCQLSVPHWEWEAMKKKDSEVGSGRKWRSKYLVQGLDRVLASKQAKTFFAMP